MIKVCASKSWSVDVDLEAIILEAIGQIPPGRVATYGDVAMAIGDVKAARAVGTVIADNPHANAAPCHRVVNKGGRLGWDGFFSIGAERNLELLRSEGVQIDGGVVDLKRSRFTDFKVRPLLQELAREQESMRQEVIEEDTFGELRYVAGIDVAYSEDRAFGSMVTFDAKSMQKVGERTVESEIRFPYIPGYLGYRETPIARELIDDKEGTIYLIDGQGKLHPRGFGVACQIGVSLGVPTIGAAKSRLIGRIERIGGTRSPVTIDGRLAGYQLHLPGRTKIYISVGHRVCLDTAADLCERLMINGVPEPQRQAHLLATAMRRSYQLEGSK